MNVPKGTKGIVWLPILIMVGSVIVFSVMAYAVYRKNVPAKLRSPSAVSTNVNTTATQQQSSTDTVDSSNPEQHTYTSPKLGITPQYQRTATFPTNVAETDDTIYLYYDGTTPEEGQFVRVFQKAASTNAAGVSPRMHG